MIRSFLAVDFPNPEKETVARYIEVLRRIPSSVKWVNPHQIHMTLKFFGAIPQETVDRIISELSPLASDFKNFKLTLKGLGGFPNLYRPRVIWLGLGGETVVLKDLQKKSDQALLPLGIPKEERPFRPHLTLGRNKSNELNEKLYQRLSQWPEEESPLFPVESLLLYRSDLKPTGAVYTKLAEFPLKKE
ncbi:MAG TPA: RNA 2',3'-cyclic phosphodiesterase [Thermodesulfobacteriota bacterium]|nr:RNA 2',3'-cyclic phosphodiesterase [Thermodesulfobacteriota bacterium]